MRMPFQRALQTFRKLPVSASWFSVGAAWLGAAVLIATLAWQDWQLTAFARPTEGLVPRPQQFGQSNDPSIGAVASGTSSQVDFVSTLPNSADPDATIRFTSRLAQDQDVRVSQMQSEFVATDAKKLGQTKFTLQLRGDYRNVKNVMIGLLAKFPGLTLQRLTVHHRDTTSGSPTDKGSDEATLELLQFARPAATP